MTKNKRPKPKVQRASISGARNLQELADFWDTHDLTDFEEFTRDVEIEVKIESRCHYVAIAPELMERLTREAQARGLSAQSLANLWIQERLARQGAGA
jgi:hypothetical protein